MILHICGDEKFIDPIIQLFDELFPKQNNYWIVENKKNSPKHEKSIANIERFYIKDLLQTNRIKQALNYEFIVLHNLDVYKALFVLRTNKQVRFFWSAFGTDIYETGIYPVASLYGPLSYEIHKSLPSPIKRIRRRYHDLVLWLRYKKKREDILISAAQRIEYVGTVIDTEFEIIRDYFSKRIKYLPFRYGHLEKQLEGRLDKQAVGRNILIGNSSSTTNNHFEIFEQLSQLQIDNRKIYVPLSYGDMNYRKKVIKEGERLLRDSFHPILDFMTGEKYNDFLLTCSSAILNHYRQQAAGVIFRSLWFGIRLYLSRRSPFYHFLQKWGCHAYTIEEDLNKDRDDIFDPMPGDLREINRKKSIEIWGKKRVYEDTRLLVATYREQ
jgi:dTDP-N-acetylfucosamine:lipid II N-acetylfucosaminyltransferase